MANVKRRQNYMSKRSISIEKYNWRTASFLEIINMSEKELRYVHPYSFEQLQPRRKEAVYRNQSSKSLSLVLPEEIILCLNEYQLSAFSNLALSYFSDETIEILYNKFKDTIVDYQEDMAYTHQGLNIGERLLKIKQAQQTKHSQSPMKTFKRGLSFFEETQMISLNSIAYLIKITDYKYRGSLFTYTRELREVIQDYEIIPKNKALYEELKEKLNTLLYNYTEIKKWIFKDYKGNKKEDNLLELYRFKDILSHFIKEGYLTTANQKLNEEIYNYLRYGDFPSIHIFLKNKDYKLYFLSEIEEYVQNFQKTGIIPIETPLNKEKINKIEK